MDLKYETGVFVLGKTLRPNSNWEIHSSLLAQYVGDEDQASMLNNFFSSSRTVRQNKLVRLSLIFIGVYFIKAS